ncbi:MAG: hypothetical protein AAB267_08910, partial [Candidatus Desantisbacteria bacterium]
EDRGFALWIALDPARVKGLSFFLKMGRNKYSSELIEAVKRLMNLVPTVVGLSLDIEREGRKPVRTAPTVGTPALVLMPSATEPALAMAAFPVNLEYSGDEALKVVGDGISLFIKARKELEKSGEFKVSKKDMNNLVVVVVKGLEYPAGYISATDVSKSAWFRALPAASSIRDTVRSKNVLAIDERILVGEHKDVKSEACARMFDLLTSIIEPGIGPKEITARIIRAITIYSSLVTQPGMLWLNARAQSAKFSVHTLKFILRHESDRIKGLIEDRIARNDIEYFRKLDIAVRLHIITQLEEVSDSAVEQGYIDMLKQGLLKDMQYELGIPQRKAPVIPMPRPATVQALHKGLLEPLLKGLMLPGAWTLFNILSSA